MTKNTKTTSVSKAIKLSTDLSKITIREFKRIAKQINTLCPDAYKTIAPFHLSKCQKIKEKVAMMNVFLLAYNINNSGQLFTCKLS